MNKRFLDITLRATDSTSLTKVEEIQSLWSGYGSISRYKAVGRNTKNIVVKHVQLPDTVSHPRGWQTNLSHQRKIRSYQVESAWYKHYSHLCNEGCRLPQCLALNESEDEFLIVLEDLNESGYTLRKDAANSENMKACLKWLANFHAIFLMKSPKHVWPIGTYWHLDTRPDELETLQDSQLKSVATDINSCLNSCEFKTFVHGDAKLANFCFSNDGKQVAAVDFQYVGGGCGMKDVAYFIGSCLQEEDCQRYEAELLNSYFNDLKDAISHQQSDQKMPINSDKLEREWRSLYPVAWTDFHRFIKGWSPGHWKIHDYSEQLAHEVIQQFSSKRHIS